MTETEQLALSMIERVLGRSFHVAETTETVRVTASFAPLKHRPILTVRSVKARVSQWEFADVFGQHQASDIPLTEIEVVPTGVLLPQTLWGSYGEATVTYEYGTMEVPSEIRQAVSFLAEKIDADATLNAYSVQLLMQSEEIESLLEPYRGRR